MRNRIFAIASFAALASGPMPAAAAEEGLSACANADPNIAIIACSVLIESGSQSPADLSRDYNNRGGAFSAKGDYDHAILDLDEALKLDPTNGGALINRGNSYGAERQYDRAL
jgi:tetratricopeptide (TPR) repeat protein